MQLLLKNDMFLEYFEGNFFSGHSYFGAIVKETGTQFTLWAPNAKKVFVLCNKNNWQPSEAFQLKKIHELGVWQLLSTALNHGDLYKYGIECADGRFLIKSDPYGRWHQLRPNTASIVWGNKDYDWKDQQWFKKRQAMNGSYEEPLNIYEVHLGSWDLEQQSYLDYAKSLVLYLKKYGFTHIEIMPVTEHPLDQSWGYQSTGYFSVTSRYGTPDEFKEFVEYFHHHNIGVILDYVPGHFCKDAHGLYAFDGTHLYEYEEEWRRENVEWGTANFDLSKGMVQSFLISSMVFWIEEYHIDGFRVDAVSKLIYDQKDHETFENKAGIHFLRKMNKTLKDLHPDILLCGEDSTDYPKVTHSVEENGLGFDYKWNMGWMNDILEYMEADYEGRERLHHNLTFPILYAYSEKFILPLSHDEVVYGKKSLLNKMPGTYPEKFAQLRLLFGLFMTYPGKKLLFMGGEFAQFGEWSSEKGLEWYLKEYPSHQKTDLYTQELMQFYRKTRALWELDFSREGFQWIDCENSHQRIFSYIRYGTRPYHVYIVLFNFSPISYEEYRVGVPFSGKYREVVNSDRKKYGGKGIVNLGSALSEDEFFHGFEQSITVSIPAYGFQIFKLSK